MSDCFDLPFYAMGFRSYGHPIDCWTYEAAAHMSNAQSRRIVAWLRDTFGPESITLDHASAWSYWLPPWFEPAGMLRFITVQFASKADAAIFALHFDIAERPVAIDPDTGQPTSPKSY